MLLKPLDLVKLINDSNQTQALQYNDNSSFDFEYFDSRLIDKINKTIQAVNEGYNLYLLTENDKTTYQNQKQLKKNYSQLIKSSASGNLDLIKDTISFLKRDDVRALNERLNHIEAWSKWVATQAKSEYDNEIAKQHAFSSNADYQREEIRAKLLITRFNDTALFNLAKISLPSLLKYINSARNKLLSGKHSVPQNIGNQYFSYLNNLDYDIKKLQTYFCQSMLERLATIDESKGRFSNPLYSKAVKANPAEKSPDQPYKITSDEFAFFHEYIETHGSLEAKQQLHKSSWFIGSSTLPTTLVRTEDNGDIIAPVHLAHYIPLKKRWPNWLFGDINIRQDLFKQNALLFATLKFQSNRPDYFIDIYDPKSCLVPIEEIKYQEELIEENLRKLEKPPFNNISWYSFGTKALCSEWKSSLQAQKIKLIEDKIDLAVRLIKCLRSKIVNPIEVPWETYKLLLNLSNELEQLVKEPQVNQALQDKMYFINSTLSQYASLTKFLDGINKLANGELPPDEQLDFLQRYIENRSATEPTFLESFRKYCEPKLNAIKNELKTQLKIDPFSHRTISDLQKQSKLINSYFAILNKTVSLLDKNDINHHLGKIFLNCLQNLLSNTSEQSLDAFKVCKSIISVVGKNAQYLDKNLIDHIEALEMQKLDNPIMFYINCKSMIISLNNELLKKRFNKELIKLDTAIINELEQKGLSIEVITILLKIRDGLIKESDIKLLNLSPSDKKVLDVYSTENTTTILDLLNISSKAHIVKTSLNNDLSPAKKPQVIKYLSQSISKFLSEAKDCSDCLQNKKWFAKQYVDETVLNNDSINLTFKF